MTRLHELSLPRRWLARPQRASTPAALLPWLTDARSLTARISARCCEFRVQVLRQALDRPHPDEVGPLHLSGHARVWVREVLLWADHRPVVFGRSILPHDHASGSWRLFHGIGARPLGAALFADQAIRRSPLLSTCLDRRDARYHHALAAACPDPVPARLWARRSVFCKGRRMLLVSEVFLPGIEALQLMEGDAPMGRPQIDTVR